MDWSSLAIAAVSVLGGGFLAKLPDLLRARDDGQAKKDQVAGESDRKYREQILKAYEQLIIQLQGQNDRLHRYIEQEDKNKEARIALMEARSLKCEQEHAVTRDELIKALARIDTLEGMQRQRSTP